MSYTVTNGSFGASGASSGLIWIDPEIQLIRIYLKHYFGGGAFADGNSGLAEERWIGLNSFPTSDLWIEAEKGVETAFELRLDLFARALNSVHRHVGFVPIRQLEGCVLNLGDLAFGEQPEAVD